MTTLMAATTCVPGNILDKLNTIAAAGFTGVELFEADVTTFAGSTQDIRHHADSLGLSLDVFHGLQDFEGLKGADREAAFAQLDKSLVWMQTLGIKILLLNTSTHPNAHSDRSMQIADFHELAKRVGAAGCTAALMAVPWAQHITNEMDAFTLINAVDSPYLGLALNSVFSLSGGSQAARLREIAGERIFHVQLCDAAVKQGDSALSVKQNIGLLPSLGGLNLVSFARVLIRTGYSGAWSLTHIATSKTQAYNTYALDGFRSLVSLLDDAAKGNPRFPLPVTDLPSRVHTSGFEFIEFAVDDNSYDDLTSLLSSMSFRKERIHCSKSVELWRQGAINLVVNSEKYGFAAQARIQHGPCVCDMALRVRNADQTVTRAMMLGTPLFSQPVAAGELDIPAIKGVGGSVVHFIDEKSDLHRLWDIEFDPVPNPHPPPQPTGLRKIDHVAQTMPYQEMQSWLVYYLSTFKMKKANVIDLVDPSGLILSQALSSPEGEVRLSLNGALDHRTLAGTFVHKGVGAGVQHIAFATDDIFETSIRLQSTGFKRLHIAPEYYDDLQACFNLDDDMMSKIRTENILYDRDEQGEYFQLYSVPFWGGMFFEIVQRRRDFNGYGARNAAARLTAQTHYINEQEK